MTTHLTPTTTANLCTTAVLFSVQTAINNKRKEVIMEGIEMVN
jgi:hypothetical protein